MDRVVFHIRGSQWRKPAGSYVSGASCHLHHLASHLRIVGDKVVRCTNSEVVCTRQLMFTWRTSHAHMTCAQVHVHCVLDGTITGAHDLKGEFIGLRDVCDGVDLSCRLIALCHIVLVQTSVCCVDQPAFVVCCKTCI